MKPEDVAALVKEITDEMKYWTYAERTKYPETGGNLNWLNNRLQARMELIEHVLKTFGGLK